MNRITIKDLFATCREDAGYRIAIEGQTRLRAWIGAVWAGLVWLESAARCEYFGHRWEDDSWAGPESGGDARHCLRCGCSYHHIYY